MREKLPIAHGFCLSIPLLRDLTPVVPSACAEGFTLSVFPSQFKEFLVQADPRTLQITGLVETLVAISLIAGILAS